MPLAKNKQVNGEVATTTALPQEVLNRLRADSDAADAIRRPVVPVKTQEQLFLEAELERLKRENEALRNRPATRLSMKVSERGALSIYGMGRFPVTLYREQWEKLLSMGGEITAFIKANGDRLKVKE